MKRFAHNRVMSSVLRYGFFIAGACALILMFISFITSPFTGDIKVFIAAASQVQYQSDSGLLAVFEAWELKGIGNRLLMYVLYLTARLFTNYGDVVKFEIAVKAIYALAALACIAITAMLVSSNRKDRLVFGIAEYLAVYATYEASHLQVEMTCVVLSILMFALLAHGTRRSYIAAGVIGSLLFFFKSIFVLLPFAVFAGYALHSLNQNKPVTKKCMLLYFGSFAVAEIALSLMVLLVYPQEFVDMRAAADFQETLFSAGSFVTLESILNSLIAGLSQSTVMQPFVFIGSTCSLYSAITYARKKEATKVLLLAFMWLVALDLIVVSNKYFIYHFYLLMLPSVVSCVDCCRNEVDHRILFASGCSAALLAGACWIMRDGYQQWGIINYSTVLLVVLHAVAITIFLACFDGYASLKKAVAYLLVTACAFFWLNYSSALSPKYRNETSIRNAAAEACVGLFPQDFGDGPVLFLDGGTTPFYVEAPSYSRYFYNLPMERWSEGKTWPLQAAEYKRLMEYEGKYIVYASWFGIEKYPDLQRKLEEEYVPIKGSGIFTYSPDWEPFELSPIPDKESLRDSTDAYLLVRKGS